ncbi:hypothetical protein ISN45_Aa02g025230, partial [Arabidopsis thaliana x Arabidopsis arenosa]
DCILGPTKLIWTSIRSHVPSLNEACSSPGSEPCELLPHTPTL